MNINAAFDVKGKIDFLNTSKVKESDISFLFSVKVIDQVIYNHSLTQIVPVVTGNDSQTILDAQAFTDLRADIFFTKSRAADAQKLQGKGKNSFSLNLGFDSLDDSFLSENETTISVSYTGGGQGLKAPDQDWTFEIMKSAALRFPDLVAKTPMPTHVILTNISPPAFEVAGVYSMLLQEAYLDYKTVAKNLQVLSFEVSSGRVKLITSSEYRCQVEEAKKEKTREAAKRKQAVDAVNKDEPANKDNVKSGSDTPASDQKEDDAKPAKNGQTKEGEKRNEDAAVPDSKDTTVKKSPGPNHWRPIEVTKEYKATPQGLEDARNMVRTFLIRIVQEINILSKHPHLALEDDRVQPHMSPFLFKELLPVGQPVAPDEEQDKELANVTDRINKINAKKNDSSAL
ncbi:Ff.00g115740.m01.CDS01 [Fusarium sp. VM40]|nr:Ff.00g115740.m01.CDS01 [Fusarium sp. VM40]